MAGGYKISKQGVGRIRDMSRRIGGGKTSSRPVATRRRPGGGGGGSSLVIARALENIDAASGWLSEEESTEAIFGTDGEHEDLEKLHQLDDKITLGKGRVWIMAVQDEDAGTPEAPIPEADRLPLELLEGTRDAAIQPDDPPTVKEPQIEYWHNTLFDPIQKNSILIGVEISGHVFIIAVAPSTIRRDPSIPAPPA